MIKYKINILQKLKDNGYNTNKLRQYRLLSESNIQYLRDNKMIGISGLNSICKMLGCQPADLIEYVED